MATHTPAQAIQELVNHTAVLTERLVGLQGEVRKGMSMTPEWGNALTQVVGDTKRMLQAMEHLARLPAFHLDRDGLNAAVAAGVQQGLAGGGGEGLIAVIENNSRQLEEAKRELDDAKKRMDAMLEEIGSTKAMTPEGRQKFFMQFAPIVAIWSAGLLLAGLMMGKGCVSENAQTAAIPPAMTQPAPGQQASTLTGQRVRIATETLIYSSFGPNARPAFKGPAGMQITIAEQRRDGWTRITFDTGGGKTGEGWLQPGVVP